jgi:hypothetical protein
MFRGDNPQGGTALSFVAPSAGSVRIEILSQAGQTVRTETVTATAGLNRWQWDLQGNPPQLTPEQQAQLAQFAGRGGGGRGGQPTGVPFVAGGGGGRGGGGGFGPGGAGSLAAPGTYLVRVTVGGQTLTTAVTVLDDVWMTK